MLDLIEKLLILQDRDRKILRVRSELANIDPERKAAHDRASGTQAALDTAKLKVKQLEAERKELELEVEAKKQQIDKYSLQQFQTRKNDEYRALAHEIETCKSAIFELENRQLELMEQGEAAQKEMAVAAQAAEAVKKQVQTQGEDLAQREESFKRQLAELESGHDELAAGVDESALSLYQRLRKRKGDNPVVGVEHGVCGGCHMRLATQLIISCRAQQELVCCPNCGRILYYAPHMDLAVAE